MVKWCAWVLTRFGVGGMLKRFFKEEARVTSSCWNSDKGADSFEAECRSDHGGVGNVTVHMIITIATIAEKVIAISVNLQKVTRFHMIAPLLDGF